MIEIEIKFPLSDPPVFEEKLINIGAEFIKTEMQEDHYLQHPCRDFRVSDEALRVRLADSKIFLGYKGPRISRKMKIRRESEVEVSSFQDILNILKNLGFIDVAIIHKLRRIYRYSEFEIAIDIVDGLGDYVEVETVVSSENEKDDAIAKIKAFIRELGLDIKHSIAKSYLELYFEKQDVNQ